MESALPEISGTGPVEDNRRFYEMCWGETVADDAFAPTGIWQVVERS